MLRYASYGEELNMRLLNQNGTVLSGSAHWIYDTLDRVYDEGRKTLISNISTNYPFRISVCCYYGYTGDQSWNGSLQY